MAFDLLKTAKHIKGLSNAEFRVLFYLLDAARSKTLKCYPRIKEIAEHTEMAERTVQRHITTLAERGLFKRVEQRRYDGSRAVNCYQFIATGNIQIGNEEPIELKAEEDDWDDETEPEQQPANNGTLHNQPIPTPPPVNPDTTPRQSRRDLDQESIPGIGTYPPSSNEEATPIEKGLFGEPIPIGDDAVIEFVETEWRKLKAEHPGIAGVRKIDDALGRQILLRAKQHATGSENRIDVWKTVFAEIRKSTWLQGRVPPGQGRDTPFKLSLGWLVLTQKFREVINGKYSNERGNNNRTINPATGERLGPTGQAIAGTVERMRAARQRAGQV